MSEFHSSCVFSRTYAPRGVPPTLFSGPSQPFDLTTEMNKKLLSVKPAPRCAGRARSTALRRQVAGGGGGGGALQELEFRKPPAQNCLFRASRSERAVRLCDCACLRRSGTGTRERHGVKYKSTSRSCPCAKRLAWPAEPSSAATPGKSVHKRKRDRVIFFLGGYRRVAGSYEAVVAAATLPRKIMRPYTSGRGAVAFAIAIITASKGNSNLCGEMKQRRVG